MKKSTSISIGVGLLIIIVALGGWYAFSNPQVAAALGWHRNLQGPGMSNGNASTTPYGHHMMYGGFVTGSIEVLSDNGFTLTLQNGTTENVTTTATTTIENFVTASSTPTMITFNQLSVGEQVEVIGVPQADASIAAFRILTGTPPAPGQFRGMRMMYPGMGSSTPSSAGNGYGMYGNSPQAPTAQ